jgi:hypothetical protein
MKHKLFKDLLPASYHEILCREFKNNIDWKFTESASGVYDNYDKSNSNIKDSVQFVHSIAEDNNGTSPAYSLVLPIIWFFEKESGLTVKNILRIKANCLTNNGDDVKYNAPHIDVTKPGYASLIYYVNDSDGDTVLFNEYVSHGHFNLTELERITPKQGSAFLIPSHQYHCSSCPIISKQRIVINIILELNQLI